MFKKTEGTYATTQYISTYNSRKFQEGMVEGLPSSEKDGHWNDALLL